VVRDCADSLETQAVNLGRALPVLQMPGVLRATATESVAGLREASGRVTFATSLLQAELTEKGHPVDAAVIVRSLAQMDAAMLQAIAPMADLVERLERAAEADEACEPAFVAVIEAVGLMLEAVERAKSATEVLREAVAGEVG
jgi:hypothetical protein